MYEKYAEEAIQISYKQEEFCKEYVVGIVEKEIEMLQELEGSQRRDAAILELQANLETINSRCAQLEELHLA